MSLSRKFTAILLISIIFIAISNVISFLYFYDLYRRIYLVEVMESKNQITLDYINSLVAKKETEEYTNYIEDLFNDVEMQFFELTLDNDDVIPLDKEKNLDIVVNYLVKKWVAPEYIQEIIPTDSFDKVLNIFKDKTSPEYKLVKRLSASIICTNIIVIILIILLILILTRRIIKPVKEVTKKISLLKPWMDDYKIIKYNKKDEIWLLINAINWLNSRLKVQESIRNRLLADISHELKTPITSIQCYLEWISDWVIKLDHKNLNSITEEMTRLIELVNKIMDYEKFERKDLELSKNNTDVVRVLTQLVETHKKRLKENKQRIKVTGLQRLILNVDIDLFKQIAYNITWNFLKYAWKNSILRINVTKRYIDFTDNWKGIDSSEIPFLTDKFYQWESWKAWDIKERWMWVWLSIVKKIIKSHGWSISLKSEKWKWFSFKINI